MEFQADRNTTTEYALLTVQLPDGSTPLEGVRVPEGVNTYSINMDEKYQLSFPVAVGGHVLVSLAMPASVCIVESRFTLVP